MLNRTVYLEFSSRLLNTLSNFNFNIFYIKAYELLFLPNGN